MEESFFQKHIKYTIDDYFACPGSFRKLTTVLFLMKFLEKKTIFYTRVDLNLNILWNNKYARGVVLRKLRGSFQSKKLSYQFSTEINHFNKNNGFHMGVAVLTIQKKNDRFSKRKSKNRSKLSFFTKFYEKLSICLVSSKITVFVWVWQY